MCARTSRVRSVLCLPLWKGGIWQRVSGIIVALETKSPPCPERPPGWESSIEKSAKKPVRRQLDYEIIVLRTTICTVHNSYRERAATTDTTEALAAGTMEGKISELIICLSESSNWNCIAHLVSLHRNHRAGGNPIPWPISLTTATTPNPYCWCCCCFGGWWETSFLTGSSRFPLLLGEMHFRGLLTRIASTPTEL